MDPYAELVDEAVAASFTGWDFRWLAGRAHNAQPSWSYPDLARAALAEATRVLDIDTGGGELLASFAPLPEATIATEGYPPNVPLARDRLAPYGVEVREHDFGTALPVEDAEVDLVLNRHGRFDPAELARVLRPGGLLVTQQVGSRNDVEINEALNAPLVEQPGSYDCVGAERALVEQGFEILEAAEEWPEFVIRDIGALVFQLRAVPWQVPGFDLDKYGPALRALDERIRSEGPFVAHDHRYLLRARRR
ncbi:MAG TPA: class I SAM-dependent methyltransferase [Kribbella sp.]|uniref:class I SAM-dependent methyltransferase n=1 Tax=Kribbella sp. TaxID=1871183 RepID=UPI002D76D82C|nr:class I SAM-dependent methyltransferase [Kribbella sp.]HET6295565.1 class I SAM-dependent methyltransferase [Kribbella sp.]